MADVRLVFVRFIGVRSQCLLDLGMLSIEPVPEFAEIKYLTNLFEDSAIEKR
jgi:hypothetical protein